MKLRLALGLSVAGAALALSAAPAEAVDPPAVCDRFKGEFDRGTWTAQNAGDLRALERRVPIACSDLRNRVNARVDLVYRDRPPSGGGAPSQCPPSSLVDPILSGSDARAVRGLRDAYRESCPTVYRRAVSWLERQGGRSTLRPLVMNDPAQEEISRNDPLVENLHYDQYRVRLRPGERMAVTMRSEAFPPLLAIITGTLPNDFQVVGAENYEEFENGARLTFMAPVADAGDEPQAEGALPEAQDYVVLALSRERERTGAYTIEQHAPPPPEPPQPLPQARDVVFGATVQSSITEESPAIRNRGSSTFYEPWGFHAAAGEGVRIYMDAEYDAFLELGRLENGVFTEVASNDDGGEGLDSLILYRVEQEGDYVVRARALGGYAGGAYTLTVERLAPQQRVRMSEDANAWLVDGSLLMGFNSSQDYEFRPRRNRRYAVSVEASGFSPILDLGLTQRGNEVREVDFYQEAEAAPAADPAAVPEDAPAEPAGAAEAEAAASTRPANRIEFRAVERGPYVIRVRTNDGGGGDFSMTITEIE